MNNVDTKVKVLAADLKKAAEGSDSLGLAMKQASFDASTGAAGLSRALLGALGVPGGKSNDMQKTIGDLDKALAQLVKSNNADAAATAFQQIQDVLHLSPSVFKHYNDAVAANSAEQILNTGTSKDAAAAFKSVADVAVIAGDAEKYLTAATDAMNFSQKALQSTLQGFPASTGTDALSAVTAAHQSIFDAANKSTKAQAQGPSAADIVSAQNSITRAIIGVTTARDALLAAQQKNFTMDVKQAQENLDATYRQTTRDVYALQDAVKALNDLLHPSARTTDEANIALQRSLIDQANNTQAVADAQTKLNLAKDHALPTEIAQAQRDLTLAQYNLTESGYAVVDSQKKYDDITKNTPDHQRAITIATLDVADAQRTASDSTDATVTALKAMADLQKQIANQPNAIATAQLDLSDAINAVALAEQALVKQETSVQQKEATATFDKQISLQNTTLQELDQELQNQIKAQQDYWTNIITLGQQYGPAVVDQLLKMGKDGAGIVQKMATDTSGSSQKMADDLITNAAFGSKTFLDIIQKNVGAAPGAVRTYTAEAAAALADELGIGVQKAEQILADYGLKLQAAAGSYIIETSPGNFVTINPSITRSGGHGIPSASGNLFEDHSPQISKGGPTRIWSEPETGGEAYIPLSPSKRSRSVGILRQVAGIFGNDIYRFDTGGIALPGPLTDADFSARGNKKILTLPAEHTSRTMYQAAKFLMENGGNRIVTEGIKWLGGPYGWGGGHGGPVPIGTPVDCSGLIDQIAMALGLSGISGTTLDQQFQGTPGNSDIPGTLLFFGSKNAPHHVGISIGNNKMISALNADMGIRITGFLDDYNGTARDISRGGGLPSNATPFDQGGWLPPRSQTLMANNTRYWEPVGQAAMGGVQYHVPVHVDARIASNIDLDKAGAIIAEQVTRGVTVALSRVEAKVRQRNGG